VTPVRPAAGGGRWVEVDPRRMPRWLDGFAERHGGAPRVSLDDGVLTLTAPDGSTAQLHPPPGAATATDLDGFLAAAQRSRRLGLLLARQGSVAVGIAHGARLEASKVDSSYVQGRTAAGGWSQQRFARRRVNQAKAAAGSASDITVRLLLPQVGSLDAVVGGGDRRTVDVILSDPRLAPVAALRAERFLDLGEPRLATLEHAVTRATAVVIRIREPDATGR
jgi:VLRF1 release factor-like protein